MKKQTVAGASVVVAFCATLGVFIVTLLRGIDMDPAIVNVTAGAAVAACALAGLIAMRPGSRPRASATPEANVTRWIHTTGAICLQVTGASIWLIADGPWPPALAALCMGAGLLAARPLPPLPSDVIDLRDSRMIALIPGLETPEELARLNAHHEALAQAEEQRRLRILELRRQTDPTSEPPIVLTSRQLLP